MEGPKGQTGGQNLPAVVPGHANGPAVARPSTHAQSSSPQDGAGRPTGSSPDNAGRNAHPDKVYAALDLGTNNCRLLVARPSRRGFKVIDAFSRIIRLGEGISSTGAISDAAMERAIAALSICSDKIGIARRAGCG